MTALIVREMDVVVEEGVSRKKVVVGVGSRTKLIRRRHAKFGVGAWVVRELANS